MKAAQLRPVGKAIANTDTKVGNVVTKNLMISDFANPLDSGQYSRKYSFNHCRLNNAFLLLAGYANMDKLNGNNLITGVIKIKANGIITYPMRRWRLPNAPRLHPYRKNKIDIK